MGFLPVWAGGLGEPADAVMDLLTSGLFSAVFDLACGETCFLLGLSTAGERMVEFVTRVRWAEGLPELEMERECSGGAGRGQRLGSEQPSSISRRSFSDFWATRSLMLASA